MTQPKRKTKPAPRPSGAACLAAAGRVAILVAVSPDERQTIRVAAARAGLSMSAWLRRLALASGREQSRSKSASL